MVDKFHWFDRWIESYVHFTIGCHEKTQGWPPSWNATLSFSLWDDLSFLNSKIEKDKIRMSLVVDSLLDFEQKINDSGTYLQYMIACERAHKSLQKYFTLERWAPWESVGRPIHVWTSNTCVEFFLDSASLFLLSSFSLTWLENSPNWLLTLLSHLILPKDRVKSRGDLTESFHFSKLFASWTI